MKIQYSSKVILLVFCILLLIIPNCYAEEVYMEYADQDAFLSDMAAGINKRLSEADMDTTSMSKEENMEYYHTLVSYELEYVEKYNDQVFADEKFNALAHFYIEACQMQRYATENYRNENLYNGLWNGGSTCRSGIITTMYERYDLPISASQVQNYQLVPTYTISYDDENDEKNINSELSSGDLIIMKALVEPDMNTLGTTSECYEYRFTVQNNTEQSLGSVMLECMITDLEGNVLGMDNAQAISKSTIKSGDTKVLRGKIYTKNYDLPCIVVPTRFKYGNNNTPEFYVDVESNNALDFTLDIIKSEATPSPTQAPMPKVDIDAIVREILSCKNADVDRAWNLIKAHHDNMTESQLESCLKSYGRWAGLEYAENKIREGLKSPRSYYRYEGSASNPVKQEDGTYKTEYELKYGATNSFGAEVTDTDTVYVYFKIDTKNVRVTFVNTKLSAYDAWELAKS